uniref:Uncharacterized protein n=1 Tax=Arundo donax TaxID=35708 RepID=A0A0A9BTN1_ARUDO
MDHLMPATTETYRSPSKECLYSSTNIAVNTSTSTTTTTQTAGN